MNKWGDLDKPGKFIRPEIYHKHNKWGDLGKPVQGRAPSESVCLAGLALAW